MVRGCCYSTTASIPTVITWGRRGSRRPPRRGALASLRMSWLLSVTRSAPSGPSQSDRCGRVDTSIVVHWHFTAGAPPPFFNHANTSNSNKNVLADRWMDNWCVSADQRWFLLAEALWACLMALFTANIFRQMRFVAYCGRWCTHLAFAVVASKFVFKLNLRKSWMVVLVLITPYENYVI